MRAFYYLFYTFLITCFQYTSTNVGKSLGGLAPQAPDERRLCLFIMFGRVHGTGADVYNCFFLKLFRQHCCSMHRTNVKLLLLA